MSAFDEHSDIVLPHGGSDEPEHEEETGRKARSSRKRFFARHAKSSAVLATLGIHLALMFAALSFVVFTVIQQDEEERFAFEQVGQQRTRLRKLSMPVHIRKKTIAAAAMPKFVPVRHEVKSTVQLPELPGMKGGLGHASTGLEFHGMGLGSGIDFFGVMGGGGHVVFIIDYSISMYGDKERIMRREVARIIRDLPRETQFAVIFFAGPAWPAGSDFRFRPDRGVTTGGGAFTCRPKNWNDMPKVRYRQASYTTVSGIIEEVERTPLAWGTVYDNPIYMALSMDPIPDTIFFMTDGECDEERGIDSLQIMVDQLQAAGKKVPVMHTVGFGIMENEQLEAMAKLMGGQCDFLTAGQYIRKHGPSRRKYKPSDSDDDRFDDIESVTADQYPVEFSLQ